MGKGTAFAKGAKQLSKQVLKNTPIGPAVREVSPDLYHLFTNDVNVGNVKARSKRHPGSFSQDFGAVLNDGTFKSYLDDWPSAWSSDVLDYSRSLDEDGLADLTDLVTRGSLGEPDASHSINMMTKALGLEREAQSQVAKRSRIPQQQEVDLGTVEAPAPKEKQIRQQSTELFDGLYTRLYGEEEWGPLRQAGREDKGLKEDLIDGKGQNIHTSQRIQGLAPHHLSEKAFDIKVIGDWPEGEQLQYLKDMNSIDVFPGNHPRNWIGLFHDNTLSQLQQMKQGLQKLRKDAGMPLLLKRDLDDWFKADAHKADARNPELGRTELKSDDPEISAAAHDELMAGTLKRDWSQVLPPGKTIEDIKAVAPIISRDHQDFVHGIVNKLQSTLRIKQLIKEDKWIQLPYTERFKLLALNAIEKQNVAFNVALKRINKIRKAMGKPNASWDDIVAWMAQNPQRAAMIGWHEEVARGGDLLNQLNTTKEAITADLKPKDLKLVANVFGMQEAPNTSVKFKQWLKENG